MRPSLESLDVAVLDLETTGLFPGSHDRVVEISVVRGRIGGATPTVYTTLVNPMRDVGPTRLHGIRASDVADAPTFDEIAADIVDLLNGAVVAGHNIGFDLRFLDTELTRLRCTDASCEPLCTMRLGRALRVAADGRTLTDFCAALGIPHEEVHAAEPDARATSALLDKYVDLAERRRIRALEDLEYEVSVFARKAWELPPSSGRVRRRGAAPPAVPASYLKRLVHRLGPGAEVAAGDPRLDSYFELLDRVLDDGIVTDTEAENLVELAGIAGLSREAIQSAHLVYLRTLAAAALRDAVVTPNERRELDSVARLLGLDDAAVDDALANPCTDSVLPPGVAGKEELSGKTVCFTGEFVCNVQGTPITRELAEFLAAKAGLVPVKSVTKRLDILVVADPLTASRKAAKARSYGTRILTEQAFWRALDLSVE